MVQLSDTQTVILRASCARDDGLVFPITAKIKGGAASSQKGQRETGYRAIAGMSGRTRFTTQC